MSAVRVLTRPTLLVLHLVTLVAITGMVVAGGWQLDTYESAQQTVDAQRSGQPAVAVGEVLGPDDAFPADAVGRTVVVAGEYADAEEQFLVSGRDHDGQDGYWVVSPFLVTGVSAVDNRPSAILVVRGWTDTEAPPALPGGDVRLKGVLAPGEQGSTAVGPQRIIDVIRIPTLVGELPFDLYSAFMVRTQEEPTPSDGLTPVALPIAEVSWTTGLRNLLYALQWWLFAAFTGFVWWRICADALAR